MMIRKQQSGLLWYEMQQPTSSGNVCLIMTTREGGVSAAPFTGLNLASHVGDDLEHVLTNRSLILNQYGMDIQQTVIGEQVHGDKIAIVTAADAGKGSFSPPISGTDGLITSESNMALMSFYADCVPLYVWDEQKRVIGVAHAGWRGTVLDIAGKMVENFLTGYQSNPENIRVVIGASICEQCFEVDETVITEFQRLFDEREMRQLVCAKTDGKFLFNLKKANHLLFVRSGVPSESIYTMPQCTVCDQEFYSYRREQGKTGRMAAIIFQQNER